MNVFVSQKRLKGRGLLYCIEICHGLVVLSLSKWFISRDFDFRISQRLKGHVVQPTHWEDSNINHKTTSVLSVRQAKIPDFDFLKQQQSLAKLCRQENRLFKCR